MTGFLALVGGDEFKPGNEQQDRLLIEHARPGPAYVVPTAAARQQPDRAVATAREWFVGLGLEMLELRVLKRLDAALAKNARGLVRCSITAQKVTAEKVSTWDSAAGKDSLSTRIPFPFA